jgi:O-succinylbenzoic acid--CoA ligase
LLANQLHKAFKLNNEEFSNHSLLEKATNLASKGNNFDAELGVFLIDWLGESQSLKVKTSGSTGRPKTIVLQKEAMKASALATAHYFNLKPQQTALLCLPVSYIAGKMMLVRAMVLGLEIDTILPKIALDLPEKAYDFVAMIPSQVEKNRHQLHQIKTLIIGGGKVSHSLKMSLKDFKTKVFETYGMTETITHIAIKPVNGKTKNAHFNILPNINIGQDKRNCLVIDAPQLNSETIITNDVVNLISATEFQWLGRADNVINSGGLKLFPEQIEAKLEPYIKQRYFISSQLNPTYGEEVILVLEANENPINKHTFQALNKTELPKQVFIIPNFIETTSGKIHRTKTLKCLK